MQSRTELENEMMEPRTKIVPSANGRYYHIKWYKNDELYAMRSGSLKTCQQYARSGYIPPKGNSKTLSRHQ